MTENESPRIYVPPPLIFGGTLLIGLALDGRLSTSIPPSALWLKFLAAAILIAGLYPIIVALGLFRQKSTRPEPWQPATALVTGGIYRVTRNPMYLGMAAIYAGIALLFLSPVAGVLLLPVVAIIDRLVIAREETYLARRFGAAYDTYRQSVRRWI